MKLTAKQIKAARAMLDWSRATLSALSGVSEPNIIRLEAGGDARSETLAKLSLVFENNGIVFTATGGLEPARPELRTYQGTSGVQSFFDDVYETLSQMGGEVVITGFDEELVTGGPEFDADYVDRMSKLNNYNMRCLIKEGDTNFVASSYCDYRWSKFDEFQPVPFYAYGNKIAFIEYSVPVDAPLIVILNSRSISNAFRAHFESMWRAAKMPPQDQSK
jgi:transcriptional regulator with XRE-family HTH domain